MIPNHSIEGSASSDRGLYWLPKLVPLLFAPNVKHHTQSNN